MNRYCVGLQPAIGDAPIIVDRTCDTREAYGANRLLLCLAFGIIAALSGIANAKAQEAEPRSYTNTPVGLNFLISGYVYSEGKRAFDPDSAIADAKFHFDVWGQSAKFDVIVPVWSFAAQGSLNGQPREREMSGLGDPRFRVSVNLFGAPALSAKDFASYRQDLIVGVSLQVSAPLGQYDDSKLLNLGRIAGRSDPNSGFQRPGVRGHSRSPPA